MANLQAEAKQAALSAATNAQRAADEANASADSAKKEQAVLTSRIHSLEAKIVPCPSPSPTLNPIPTPNVNLVFNLGFIL